MKLIINIFFFTVVIVLSSCTKNETLTNNLEIENTKFSINESSLQKDATFEVNDMFKDSVESSIEYEDLVKFVTTLRIHEDMPYFTFTRIVGDFSPEPWLDFPEPLEITIVIRNEDDNIIQVISDLTQSNIYERSELIFVDLNFDGYLDMRLLRWSEGAGLNRAFVYFWFWDTEKYEFVLNEQLIEIGYATELSVNSDNRQIVVFNRGGDGYRSQYFDFYEFHDGNLTLVVQENYTPELDDEHNIVNVIITRKDVRTGITTVEIEPYTNE